MQISTPSSRAAAKLGRAPEAPFEFDPDEIRRLVNVGRERGLIKGGEPIVREIKLAKIEISETPVPVRREGKPLVNLEEVESRWMDVTPAMAQEWLANNFRNRTISKDVVTAYARDMVNGVWIPTHQGIAFNDRDELIDGQHRLHAIIVAGLTIRTMVTFGLPSEIVANEMTTMDAVDRGRTRSVADQLKIQHGFKNGALLAAVCASLGTICYGARTRRLSVGQTLEIYRAFEVPVTTVTLERSKEPGLRTAGLLAAFAFAMRTEADERGAIGQLFDQVISGDDVAKGSPIALLREFLTSDEAKLFGRSTDRGMAELVLQAILLQITGQKVAKLELAQDGIEHFRAAQRDRVEKIAEIFRLP